MIVLVLLSYDTLNDLGIVRVNSLGKRNIVDILIHIRYTVSDIYGYQ